MRVYTVQKSRKETKCGRCSAVIPVGSKYYYFEPRYGARQVRCSSHYPRPSDLTSSDKLSTIYRISEDLQDELNGYAGSTLDDAKDYVSGLISSLETAAEEARGVGEEYETSASNMEEYFPGGSSKIDEIREKSEACESWAEELESAGSGLEDYQGRLDSLDEPEEPEEPEDTEDEEAMLQYTLAQDHYDEEIESLNSEIESILEEVTSDVEEALGNLEL